MNIRYFVIVVMRGVETLNIEHFDILVVRGVRRMRLVPAVTVAEYSNVEHHTLHMGH